MGFSRSSLSNNWCISWFSMLVFILLINCLCHIEQWRQSGMTLNSSWMRWMGSTPCAISCAWKMWIIFCLSDSKVAGSLKFVISVLRKVMTERKVSSIGVKLSRFRCSPHWSRRSLKKYMGLFGDKVQFQKYWNLFCSLS